MTNPIVNNPALLEALQTYARAYARLLVDSYGYDNALLFEQALHTELLRAQRDGKDTVTARK